MRRVARAFAFGDDLVRFERTGIFVFLKNLLRRWGADDNGAGCRAGQF